MNTAITLFLDGKTLLWLRMVLCVGLSSFGGFNGWALEFDFEIRVLKHFSPFEAPAPAPFLSSDLLWFPKYDAEKHEWNWRLVCYLSCSAMATKAMPFPMPRTWSMWTSEDLPTESVHHDPSMSSILLYQSTGPWLPRNMQQECPATYQLLCRL